MTKRSAGLTFIMITLAIDVLGIGLLVPVLPELVTSLSGGDLSRGSAYYGWFIAVYAGMQFLFAPILGGLSDRYGRRNVLLISLFGAGVDYLLMALAPTLALLFVGRVISGITGANITAAHAYIADVSAPEDRAKNFGLVGAVFGVGFILGPAVGGVLAGIDLRAPFFAAAGLALLNWLYGYFVLPESLAQEHRRPFAWRRANPIGSLRGLARNPFVLGLAVVFVCFGLAHNALTSTWVLYTTYRFGWTAVVNGLSLALVGLLSALVQGVLVRALVPRIGERRAILVGLSAITVGLFAYGSVTEGWMMYLVMLVAALGGLAGPTSQALVSQSVGADEQGEVQGALSSLMSLTGVAGPLVGTGLFGYFTSSAAPVPIPGAALYFGGVLSLVALVVALRLFRRPRAPVREWEAAARSMP